MTDEALTLAHILDHLTRKASERGLAGSRKTDIVSEVLGRFPVDEEKFFHFLEKEFHVVFGDVERQKSLPMTLESLAFYISRTLSH